MGHIAAKIFDILLLSGVVDNYHAIADRSMGDGAIIFLFVTGDGQGIANTLPISQPQVHTQLNQCVMLWDIFGNTSNIGLHHRSCCGLLDGRAWILDGQEDRSELSARKADYTSGWGSDWRVKNPGSIGRDLYLRNGSCYILIKYINIFNITFWINPFGPIVNNPFCTQCSTFSCHTFDW